MNHLRQQRLFVALVLTAVGCSSDNSEPARMAPQPPSAKERFESLVAELKRQYDLPVNNVVGAETLAAAVTSAKTEIQHELFTPDQEGAKLRGVVTIATKSTTTVVVPRDEEEDKETSGDSGDSDNTTASGAATDSLRQGANPMQGLTNSPIKKIETENKRELEFEFSEDKWVLLTEIDQDKEPFTASAVEYALKRQ